MEIKVQILAFGACKDIIGSNKYEQQLPESSTVSVFKTKLYSDYPDLKRLNSLFLAVNEEYADDEHSLADGDTIALIPPVSGG